MRNSRWGVTAGAAAIMAAAQGAAQTLPPSGPASQETIQSLSAAGLDPAIAGRPTVVPGEFLADTRSTPVESIAARGFMGGGLEVVDQSVRGGFAVVRASQAEGFSAFEPPAAVDGLVPNYYYYSDAAPNDPEAGKLWMIDALNAAGAWGVHFDASTVTVAVIDSGVQINHEDIIDNLWVNTKEIAGNGVDDDGNGFIDDIHGWDFGDGDPDPSPVAKCSGVDAEGGIEAGSHGTHVAGTVGAVGGNGKGVIGVAPKVRIMAIKATRTEGPCGGLSAADWLRGAIYAAENGAQIINLSLGGPQPLKITQQVLEAISAYGVMIVVSAGNNGLDNDAAPHGGALVRDGKIVYVQLGPNYPASFDLPTMLSVAATTPPRGQEAAFVKAWRGSPDWDRKIVGVAYNENGEIVMDNAALEPLQPGALSIGSAFGRTRVHVAAPGEGIFSTSPVIQGDQVYSGYADSSGTSMSAPAVAGAAALVWSAFPEMSAIDVKARLIATSRPSSQLADRVLAGGQIDLYAALCAPGAPRQLQGCAADQTSRTPAAAPAPAATPAASSGALGGSLGSGGGRTGQGATNLNEVLK